MASDSSGTNSINLFSSAFFSFYYSAADYQFIGANLLITTTARINYYELFKIRKRIIKSLSFIPK